MDDASRQSLWRDWFWPVLLAATIFTVSGRGEVAAPNITDIDKIAHFSVFGLLTTLVARTRLTRNRPWLAVLIVSLYGATDELHQSFTPGRSVEIADWVVDTLGAILAVAMYSKWSWYRRWLEAPVIAKSTD